MTDGFALWCDECNFTSSNPIEGTIHRQETNHSIQVRHFLMDAKVRVVVTIKPEVKIKRKYSCPLCELYWDHYEQAEAHLYEVGHQFVWFDIPYLEPKNREWTEQEQERLR